MTQYKQVLTAFFKSLVSKHVQQQEQLALQQLYAEVDKVTPLHGAYLITPYGSYAPQTTTDEVYLDARNPIINNAFVNFANTRKKYSRIAALCGSYLGAVSSVSNNYADYVTFFPESIRPKMDELVDLDAKYLRPTLDKECFNALITKHSEAINALNHILMVFTLSQ